MNLENLISKGRKAITRTLCAGLAASILFLTACPPPVNSPSPPEPPVNNELSENTKVLADSDISGIYSVGENQITLSGSDSANYYAGEIIAVGRTDKTPEGLLRKVSSVSGNIIYTEPTSIEDAVKNVTFSTQKKLSRADVRSFASMKGVSQFVSSMPLVDFNLGVGISSSDAGGVAIDGNIAFNSDLVLEIDVRNHHLDRFLFENVAHEESGLQLTVASSLANLLDKKFSLAHYDFAPFTVFLPTVPPFPIVITPKLEVVAGIEGGISPITVSASQSVDSELGLKYENSSWSIIKNITPSHNFTPISFAETSNLKAYVGPKLDFLVYGAAGPYAEVNGYLNLKLSNGLDWLELYGGLEGILGVNMKIFSRTLFDFSTSLIDFNWLLGSWEKTGPKYKIVFTSQKTSSVGTYVIGSDGTNLQQLIDGYGANPSWSPDGKKIVYNLNSEIYTKNLDGSNTNRLTNDTMDDREPDWSPDGTQIVLSSSLGQYYSHNLYILKSDGSNKSLLSIPNFNGYELGSPRWSPDGSKIAFEATEDGSNYEIYTINKNGTGLQKLTNIARLDLLPTWSPDGSKIAFVSERDGNMEIYVMNSNGSGQTRLTYNDDRSYPPNSTIDSDPCWSPDGSKIMFVSGRNGGYYNLYTMNPDGSNVHEIPTIDYSSASSPRYSPVPIQ